MKAATIQKRIEFWEGTLEKLMAAYEALAAGGTKSYMIDDRQVTKIDLPVLRREIDEAEAKIEALTNELNGPRPRKAFGIIPSDW